MFALELRFLTGRYVATTFNDRRSAEWPPHPARVFSALVAALADGEPEAAAEERAALAWLEAQPPPEVWGGGAGPRTVFDHYVPTNDATAVGAIDALLGKLEAAEAAVAAGGGKSAARALDKSVAGLRTGSAKLVAVGSRGGSAAVLPPLRSRQPRTFPVVIPHEPVVRLVWGQSAGPERLEVLDALCARVARVGHSSSLVALRALDATEEPPGERWVPDPAGDLVLRWVSPGQLERLEALHARHGQVEPRVLPAMFTRYGRPTGAVPVPPTGTHGDDWVVFALSVAPGEGPRHYGLAATEHITRAMRGWFLRSLDGVVAPELTGHAPDGSPTRAPHVAFLALADVGHPHASGAILGVALALPRDLPPEVRTSALRAIGQGCGEGVRLTLGRHGVVELTRLTRPDRRRTLQVGTWSGVARRWATVTPIALDRNPGDLLSRKPGVVAAAVAAAEASIADACERAGFPRPEAVWIHKRSLFDGAPEARRFAPYPRVAKGGPKRVCVHAEVWFDVPVAGPVLLGAGRHFGVGLLRPRGNA